ncbi:MAG: ATP-dependent zinc metalloprotease FtsH [Planctomycetaceae bacterium]
MSSESTDSPEESPPRPVIEGKEAEGDKTEANKRGVPGIGLILVLLLLFAIAWQWIKLPGNIGSRVDYSFFRQQMIEDDNVKSVTISDSIMSANSVLTGTWKTIPENPKLAEDKDAPKLDAKFNTVIPLLEGERLLDDLEKQHVSIDARDVSVGPLQQMLVYLLLFIPMMAFLFIMMRRSSDPFGSGMFGSFIRSPAKRFKPSEKHNTFDDVAGMEHAKRELQEVVEFLKNPAKFQRLGAEIPKGVLLMGPPGTGKTLLARATAGEAGVPFFSINGSEFIQMFVGVGASRVRDMFRTAKESAPSILFVDEIDAVGRIRGAGVGSGQDEREQTLNQILSEMDGFESNEAVIVIAATNRPDVLDPALLRPGRFDRHVTVEKPTREGRVGVLKVHSRKVPLADDVDLNKVASGTIGFSGADLRNLVNEAALNATREGKDAVDMEDFDAARDRILMGAKREELLNEHEREMTAYHEAGHALLAWLIPDVDSVHKVTIIPRGRALGVTQLLPDEERHSVGETRLHSELAVLLGGRAAEKLVFDEFSANAEDDLKRATSLARRMVGYWGMSGVIGPVAFRNGEEHPFLGKEMHEQRQYSDETAHVIDQEMQHFLNDASNRATQILQENRDKLDAIAAKLQSEEMVDRDELVAIIGPQVDRRMAVSKVP